MSTTAASTDAEFISAVTSASMGDHTDNPAFVINPQAHKHDLLSWCMHECDAMEHLATVGGQEIFAGDPERTVEQLRGRLEVLSNVLHRIADLEKPQKEQAASQASMH